MVYTYTPKGVCSRQFEFDVEEGIVKSVKIMGGCHGNLQGVSRLVEGMTVEDAVSRIKGIRCGYKETSCPDQLAQALTAALEMEKKQG